MDPKDGVREAAWMAKDGMRKASPAMRALARVGFATKGILYMIVGFLAARAAMGLRGDATTGPKGALTEVFKLPFGQALLWVMTFGLFGLAAWRFATAAMGGARYENGAKGIAKRVLDVGKGILAVGFGVVAARVARGLAQANDDDPLAQSWTATAFEWGGEPLVLVAGLIAIGYCIGQLVRAWRGNFLKELDARGASREWVDRSGRFGIAARGIVFGVIGGFLLRAGMNHDAGQAKGFSGALQSLEGSSFGPWLLAIVAIGLIAHGLFGLAEARYRIIR